MSGGADMKVVLSGETEYPVVRAGDEKKMLAMACVKAPEMKEEESDQRAAVKICAVIDRSGSMRGAKLNMVAHTLEFVVRELSAADEFGIVAYDNNVTKPLPMLPMTKENQVQALNAIRSIRPGGATNLSGGLLQGMKEILQHRKAAESASTTGGAASHCVWLFTDGHANEGITTTTGITAAMDEVLGDEANLILHTFGFGTSHNDSMLRSLAESGNGQYYYIEDASVIKETFAECLGGLLTVVATDLEVEVVPGKGVTAVSCLNDLNKDLSELKFKMKDIYSEETRDFVVEFNLPPTEPTDMFTVAHLKLTYTNFTGTVCSEEVTVTIPRPEAVDDEKVEINEGLDMQRNRLETANALKQAKIEADNGDFEKAKATINVTQGRLKASKCYGKVQVCDDLYQDLEDASSRMVSKAEWSHGTKCVNATEMSHRMQRSCGAKTKYKTKKQTSMITTSLAHEPTNLIPIEAAPAATVPVPSAGNESFLSRSLRSGKNLLSSSITSKKKKKQVSIA